MCFSPFRYEVEWAFDLRVLPERDDAHVTADGQVLEVGHGAADGRPDGGPRGHHAGRDVQHDDGGRQPRPKRGVLVPNLEVVL